MIKKILLGLVVIVIILVAVVALQPSQYKVERAATMKAPPEKVFAQVNDLHKWKEWSPWEKLDPKAKVTFEGKEVGEGSVFKWSGNDEIGEGTMTIVESHPNDFVRIKLDFVRPFVDTCDAEFHFVPVGKETQVTWSMKGKKTFVTKAVCMVMDMDKMLGGQFEDGLKEMKTVVERQK